jgi:ATP/ADP translocase
MPSTLQQFFKIRAGETHLVLVMGAIILGNGLAQKISEIVSVSNFVTDVGTVQFLGVLIITSSISMAVTGLQSLLVDRFNRIHLLRIIGFGLGLSFVLLRLLFIISAPSWLTYGLFYLLSEQQLVFFPMAFWVLANDVFDVSQSKRLFPLLGSIGFIGSLIGIGIAAISPTVFQKATIKPEEILMVNILIYLLLYLIVMQGLRRVKLRQMRRKVESMQATLSEGWKFVQDVPVFRFLTIAILGIIVCETAIEYHFLVVSEAAFEDTASFQIFFSLFTLGRILIYMLVQAVVTQRVVQNIGLKNTFLIQPISSLLASMSMLVFTGLGGGVVGIVFQKLPQYTIDETARKTLQGFVPEERRGRVSLFMDSYLVSVGIIVGACLTGISVLIGRNFGYSAYFYIYLSVAAIAAALAIWSISKMRSVYDNSLFNWRLKRRQRGKSVLDKIDF